MLLGAASWAVATRVLTPVQLGQGYALLSLVILLAGASHVGLNYGFIRFAPSANRHIPQMVNAAQSWVALLAATSTVVVVLALGAPVPGLPAYGVALVAAGAASWALYTLGDSLLLALGKERTVFIRTISVNSLRVLFLPLAAPLGALSFVVALAAAGALGALVTTTHLIRGAVPTYRPAFRLTFHAGNRIWRYSLATYLAATIGGAPALLMPVLVNALAGSLQAAQFSLAWVIASVVALVPSALSVALFVHLSRNSKEMEWPSVVQGIAVSVALTAAALLTQPIWRPVAYDILGPQYEPGTEFAGTVLVLSGIPIAVNSALTAVLRYSDRLRDLTISAAFTTVSIVTLTVALVPSHGIDGAAAAWTIGQGLGGVVFVGFGLAMRSNARPGLAGEAREQ